MARRQFGRSTWLVSKSASQAGAEPRIHEVRGAVRFGKKVKLGASVEVTSGGIISIGVAISSVLLSTAVLVRAAKR
jgi:hypothetical protein